MSSSMSAPPSTAAEPGATGLGRVLRTLFGVLLEGRTYGSLLYLSLGLPLGLLYALLLGTGFALGALLSVAGVGLLLVLGCVVGAWGCALFERELAILLLGVDIPPMAAPGPAALRARQRLTGHLRRSVTWKSMAFLMLKLPIGLLVSTGGLGLLSLSVLLLLSPVTVAGGGRAAQNPAILVLAAWLTLAGAALLIVTLHLANRVARALGSLAVLMLGVGEEER